MEARVYLETNVNVDVTSTHINLENLYLGRLKAYFKKNKNAFEKLRCLIRTKDLNVTSRKDPDVIKSLTMVETHFANYSIHYVSMIHQ